MCVFVGLAEVKYSPQRTRKQQQPAEISHFVPIYLLRVVDDGYRGLLSVNVPYVAQGN